MYARTGTGCINKLLGRIVTWILLTLCILGSQPEEKNGTNVVPMADDK